MARPIRTRTHSSARRWGRYAFIAILLGLIGFGAYSTFQTARASLHLRAAQRELDQRHFAAASEHLTLALETWPSDTGTLLLAAQTARRDRRYDEAAQLLERYRKGGGVPAAVTLERTLARAQRGQFQGQERSLLEAAKKETPEAPLILEAMAQGFLETYRWAEALHVLDQLIELEPANGDAYFWRGWVQQNIGDVARALADWRQAVQLSPENDDARLSLAEVLLQSSLPQEACTEYERLLDRRPSDPAVRLGLARARRLANQPEQARQLLEDMVAESPNDARVLAELAKVAVALGKDQEAESWYRRALALAPNEREPNYDFVLCLKRLGKDQEANEVAARLARIEADTQRLQELQQAIILRPDDLTFPCEVAEILLRNGQTADAQRRLRAILDRDPACKRAHALFAQALESTGQKGQALRHRQLAQ